MSNTAIQAQEHWAQKNGVKLFLYEKHTGSPENKPAIVFVHGSSMAGQATFDFKMPGRPYASALDYFAEKGFDAWCVDMKGYGRSDKTRNVNCDIANGVDDLAAATHYITQTRGTRKFMLYGNSSGALRVAALPRATPSAWRGLHSMQWCGPAQAAPRSPSARKNCRSFKAPTAGRSTARLCVRCSRATASSARKKT